MKKYLTVMCTVPDSGCGEKIAREVLERRLAACVTINGPGHSFYWWEDKITHDNEYLLIMKTTSNSYHDLELLIRDLHPYEIPEIIALPIQEGYSRYLDWIAVETDPEKKRD